VERSLGYVWDGRQDDIPVSRQEIKTLARTCPGLVDATEPAIHRPLIHRAMVRKIGKTIRQRTVEGPQEGRD